jgi:hypothetical protein
MLEACGGFCFAAKALQVCFGGPGAETDHFKRHVPIETLLMRTIDHSLAASADFLQQFIIAKVAEDSCRSRGFLSIRHWHAVIAGGVNHLGYSFLI